MFVVCAFFYRFKNSAQACNILTLYASIDNCTWLSKSQIWLMFVRAHDPWHQLLFALIQIGSFLTNDRIGKNSAHINVDGEM